MVTTPTISLPVRGPVTRSSTTAQRSSLVTVICTSASNKCAPVAETNLSLFYESLTVELFYLRLTTRFVSRDLVPSDRVTRTIASR